MKLFIEIGPQILALGVALVQIRKLNLGYFFIFLQLILTISTDILAMSYNQSNESNEFIYNYYLILETTFLSAAVYFSIENKFFKKIITVLLGLYYLISILTFSFSSVNVLNYPALISGFFLLALFNLYFIIHPNTKKSLTQNPMMVISIGQVVYFLGVTPYYVGRHVLISDYPELADTLFSYINISLAFIRYLSILIGFSILLYINYRKSKA